MASSKKQKNNLKESGEKARDLFYAGVGFAAHAKEHVAGLVEELKKQGKVSKPEGEKIVKDFIADTKKARDKFEADVKNAVNEVTQKAALASQKELDVLKKRLLELEGKGLNVVKNILSGNKGKVADAKKKATGMAKTVASTAKKVAAAKTPAKAGAAVKAGAKKVVKTATAKPTAKKATVKKSAPAKKAAPAQKATKPKVEKKA